MKDLEGEVPYIELYYGASMRVSRLLTRLKKQVEKKFQCKVSESYKYGILLVPLQVKLRRARLHRKELITIKNERRKL